MTEVVIIAGNHDYLKRDSYYRTFQWSKNVHMILDREIQCVEFPAYSLAIYGMSYDTKQITEECYCDAFAQRRQPYEILLAHGGDDSHIPIKKENLLGLGYDYIAMGHIHKPQIICPDKLLTPERWSQSIKTILERTDTFTGRLRPRDAG